MDSLKGPLLFFLIFVLVLAAACLARAFLGPT